MDTLKIQYLLELISIGLLIILILFFIVSVNKLAKMNDIPNFGNKKFEWVLGLASIIYGILWLCSIALIIFGIVNIMKGYKKSGGIALIIGLLWIISQIFNFGIDYSLETLFENNVFGKKLNICFSGDNMSINSLMS